MGDIVVKEDKGDREMKHTELPWKLYQEKFRPEISDKVVVEIQDANGSAIIPWGAFDAANQPKKERMGNYRLIVRACNCHYQLLEALQATRGQWIHSVNADKCLQAIAKATE